MADDQLLWLKTSRHPIRSHKPPQKGSTWFACNTPPFDPRTSFMTQSSDFFFSNFFESVKSHSLPFWIRISQHCATRFNSFSPWSRPPKRCQTNKNDEHPLTIVIEYTKMVSHVPQSIYAHNICLHAKWIMLWRIERIRMHQNGAARFQFDLRT